MNYTKDIFNEVILCSRCGIRMKKEKVVKDGFLLRAWRCEKCGKRVYHPGDIEKYKRFLALKKKPFSVKLRIVGNSYAVSIPKEIVEFINKSFEEMREIEKEVKRKHEELKKELSKEFERRVKLCLEKADKIALLFE